MSKINVSTITNRTGTSGPVLSGVTTATNGFNVTGGLVGIGTDNPDVFNPNADDLVISGTGHQGLTIRSGNAHDGSIMFNDTDNVNQRGIIRYIHGGSDGTDTMAFHTSSGEALRIDSLGSVQFQGSNRPAGLDTRISQYGSLLVATTDDLITSARCSIDSGNGNITSSGAATLAGTMQSGVLRVKDPAVNNDFIVATPDGTMYAQNTAGTVNWQLNPSGSIAASSVNLQSSGTSSWFQTGNTLGSFSYVWAAKNSTTNIWHSGLQTDGDLYLGGNLVSSNNIALNGSNGSGWFTGSLGIGGNGTANTMDEYEEGTYTPKLYAGTGTTEPAYDWQHGQYVRIGEVVHVWAAMGISGSMPTCSSAYLGNLPYNIALDNNNNFIYTLIHGYTFASGYGDSGDTERLFLQISNTFGSKIQIVTGGTKVDITQAAVGTNQRFTFKFSYVVG